jgi:putative DNA primase/helicase
MKARFMRAEFFEFMPQLKLWIAANNKPRITDTTRAMWRRVKLIPFSIRIPEGDQDKHYEEKLKMELPGILRWALEGCRLWREEGFSVPEEVEQATAEYREEQDPVTGFIEEKLVTDPAARIQSANLYGLYKDYCEEIGDKNLWTMTKLAAELKERGFTKEKTMTGAFWLGFGQK